jgi:integrase
MSPSVRGPGVAGGGDRRHPARMDRLPVQAHHDTLASSQDGARATGALRGIRLLATIIEAYFIMADRLPWGTRTGVYKAVKRLAKLAGIVKPLTPHGLRATGATWFAEAGWTTEELKQHFGWRLIKTAQHYVESSGEAAIRAMKEKGDKVL